MRIPVEGDVVNYRPRRGDVRRAKVLNVEVVCDLELEDSSGRYTAYNKYHSESGDTGTWSWPEETKEAEKLTLSAVNDPEYTDPMAKLKAIADELGVELVVNWHAGLASVELRGCSLANIMREYVRGHAGASGAAAEKVLQKMGGQWIMWSRDGVMQAMEMPAYKWVEPEKPAEEKQPGTTKLWVETPCGKFSVDVPMVDGYRVVQLETLEYGARRFLQACLKQELKDAVTALWQADEAGEPAALDAIAKVVKDLREAKEEAGE